MIKTKLIGLVIECSPIHGGSRYDFRVQDRHLQIAVEIIQNSSREKPADTVLRTELRNVHGLAREEGRLISAAVFAYFRWRGWLDTQHPLVHQINEALQKNHAFKKLPRELPEAELSKAAPQWVNDYMDVSPEWLRSLQYEPALWLRARPGQGTDLSKTLGHCWAAGTGLLADTLRYSGPEDLFRSPEFHEGKFELQDISSQIVGMVCNPKPGETWWDACAGEGGKMLHLCDLMQNKGLVCASDRAEWRLQQLKRRAARARLFNYRSFKWNAGPKPPVKTKFDGILVDAPCSGVGTWQRNPHARWTTEPRDVTELAEIQKQLLSVAVGSLKPGGRLIYSVCTLTRTETSEVAESISARFPELEPVGLANPLKPEQEASPKLFLYPQHVRGSGMFIAAWKKRE